MTSPPVFSHRVVTLLADTVSIFEAFAVPQPAFRISIPASNMLKSLTIENYALIAHTEIEWGTRLNLITGETGAGKSMVIGAMGLIFGRRADAAVLRVPDKKCVVEAIFMIQSGEWKDFEDVEIDDDELVIRREILPSGKSRAFVNDSPANLQTLRKIADRLADVHGQNESVLLQNPDVQLEILDKYAGLDLRPYAMKFKSYRHALGRLAELKAAGARALREAEFLRFQSEELGKVALKPGEDDELERDLARMSRAEEIGATVSGQVSILEADENSVTHVLAAAVKSLEKLSGVCPELGAEAQKLAEARTLVSDAVAELERIVESIELDPRELERLQRRLNVVNKLKVKYGARTVDDLLTIQNDVNERLSVMDGAADEIPRLEAELARWEKDLPAAAAGIEQARKAAAKRLDEKVNALLEAVGFKGAAFFTEVSRIPGDIPYEGATVKATASGFNAVRFMVRTNVGSNFGPLDLVASGGEISRILLALKTALAEKMDLSLLIFDEIDTGVGGETALKVGKVLEALAAKHQVLAVTHLPQIAARNGNHYYVYKETDGETTVSRVVRIDGESRATEIAKMMSGAESPSEAALRSARELIAG